MIFDTLLAGSWRGIPIQITDYNFSRSPAKKTHMGAFWTAPVVEYLGIQPCRISVEGFLTGDFAITERKALQALVLAPGDGVLILPSYGILTCSCVGADYHEDTSDVIEFRLEFIEVKSPFGDTVGAYLTGNIPQSIADSAANTESNLSSDFANQMAKLN